MAGTAASARPTSTRRALHYNTPKSALSPRSAASASTPHTASTASTSGSGASLLDVDSWQSDTEAELERLILQAELVLSAEKQRVQLGLAHDGDDEEALDEPSQRELRDLLLLEQARRLASGVPRELEDILQRSVAEEKEGHATLDAKDGSAVIGGGQGGLYAGGASHSSSALQRVREMSQYNALLEAKVDDLQAELDANKPALALASAAQRAKVALQQQLAAEQARCEALQSQLHALQAAHRDAHQQLAQLEQRLGDVSGSYESSEALLAEQKQRGSQYLREREEARAERRVLDERLQQAARREAVVQSECDRRLRVSEAARRDGVRMKVMGVLSVGLVVAWAGLGRWASEYLRSQPQLYTF